MNSFLLTVSGVLFLMTCGLSYPIDPTRIIQAMRKDVTCNDTVALFVPSLEDMVKNLDGAAMCLLNQLETINSKCRVVEKSSTLLHARGPLKHLMKLKDAKCIIETKEMSYSSFLEKYEKLIQLYNSNLV